MYDAYGVYINLESTLCFIAIGVRSTVDVHIIPITYVIIRVIIPRGLICSLQFNNVLTLWNYQPKLTGMNLKCELRRVRTLIWIPMLQCNRCRFYSGCEYNFHHM